MNNPLRGVRRKVAAVAAIALVASLSQVAPTSAANPARGTRGGDLTVGIFNQLLGTCFSPNATNSALGIMQSVYEGLVEQRSDGRIVPYLAQSVTPSADYKSWTIKLRPGIKFHDGTTLDVATAIANIQATRGYYFLGTAAAVGQAAALTRVGHTLGSGVPFTSNFKDVRPISADTFVIDLWSSQIDFPETLYASGRTFTRAMSDLTDRNQCLAGGKGTGPFMFEKVTPNETKVVRNPNYWRKDAAGVQLPYLDSITFKTVNNPTQRVNGLNSGSLDAAQFTSAGEVKQIVNVRKNRNLQTISSPDDFYPTWWLNQAIEPFNNKNARLAFAHALDNATLHRQRNCFQGTCVGNIPTSMVGRNNVMYNQAGFVKFSVAESKKYQAAYKAETGKDLTFTIPADTSPESQANAKAVQQLMRKAGISTTILTEDTATQVAKAFPSPTSGQLNPYQAYPVLLFEGRGTGFILPFIQSNGYADPNNLTLRSPAGALLGAFGRLINVARVNDSTLDNLVWTARGDITGGRNAKLKAVTKYVQENAIAVPTPTQLYMYAFRSNVKGFDRFTLASGGQGRPMTNSGVRWTQVYIQK